MKKYILKSNATGNSTERILDDFTQKDFKAWENNTMSKEELLDLQQQAEEDQGFEWWIEEQE